MSKVREQLNSNVIAGTVVVAAGGFLTQVATIVMKSLGNHVLTTFLDSFTYLQTKACIYLRHSAPFMSFLVTLSNSTFFSYGLAHNQMSNPILWR